jgi:hypothetical protein
VKPGLYGYIGAPGTGKTFLARRELLELVREQRIGALVVDSAHVETLADLRAAGSLEEALGVVYHARDAVRWTPENLEELARALRALRAGGRAALLVDELRWWSPGGKKLPDELLTLCRTWRHSQVSVFLTTQAVTRDLGAELLACELRLRIFRLTATPSLEWGLRWLGLDPAKVATLADRCYLEAGIGGAPEKKG